MEILKKNLIAILYFSTITLSLFSFANAAKTEPDLAERTKDVVTETYEDARDGAKKAYRKVEDKNCEMINGKIECETKKVANKVKNTTDKVKDKANDVKRN